MSMRLLSIQVGRPTAYAIPGDDDAAPDVFTSAIGKQPVAGPVRLSTGGLAGDQVADRRFHGGRDQAVLAYSAEHYPHWRAEWERADLPFGSFGENLTIGGADEQTVCLGDQWAIGDAVLEVSKPRTPCNRLAWFHRRDDVIARVRDTGRSGWYLRVLVEGVLEAGRAVTLAARPHPELTVRRAARAMANRHRDEAEAALLARCPGLAEDWRHRLAKEGFLQHR
jgi:MOSC domain-containing protein YiiM